VAEKGHLFIAQAVSEVDAGREEGGGGEVRRCDCRRLCECDIFSPFHGGGFQTTNCQSFSRGERERGRQGREEKGFCIKESKFNKKGPPS
jgi:hypothetical protein